MAMTVRRRKDTAVPRVIMHKVADIRGGVSVNVTELGGDYLPEGAVLSAPVDGICHVVKVAKLAAAVAADDTTVKVAKGHNFKAGDIVMLAEGAQAHAIASIDSSAAASDTLTLGAALGAAAEAGAYIMEAAAEAAATESALKYEPFAIAGTGKPVIAGVNLDTDAWLVAVTKGGLFPEAIYAKLKGIINY